MSRGLLRHRRVSLGLWLAVLLAAPSVVVAAPRSPASSPAGPDPIAKAPAGTTSWVVALKPGKDPTRLAAQLSRGVGGQSGQVFSHALHGFVFKGSAKAADALRRNPNVRSIEADGVMRATADTIGTGVSRIRANHATPPSAYASGFKGDGVRVAILDTGIDLTHPDLVPNLDTSLGANCITTGPPQDGHGHGTHVAGIVAAADDNEGMIGVAPHARLVPFKVLDDTGQGQWSNLICAIDIITGYATDSDPSNDIQVANMSLGDVGGIGTCTDGFVREAICTSVAAGVTYVAAAGNSTTDAGTFIPAAMPEVISVSAITDLDGEPGGLGGCWLFFLYCDDTLAEYSNYGPSVDLTAPGTQITSDWTGGTYATEMGTSMAAPHVSGAAALLLSAFPGMSPADVMDQLRTSGECPNGQLADADGTGSCAGKGQWGNDPDGIAEPLVNALNAVSGGIPGDRRPSVHMTSPAAGATVSGIVNVTASATDDKGVTKVDFLVNGVQAGSDSNGADGWSFSWNTTGLDPGLNTLTAKATDTAGQTSKSSITVQVGANVQGNWVGTFGHDGYVLGGWYGGTTDLAALPPGVTYGLDQGGRYVWASPATDVRALQSPDQSERRSTTWYDKASLQLHLSFTNAYTGSIHLYSVDWDAYGGDRLQNVTIDDGHGPRTVELSSSFFNGAWINAPVNVAAGGTVRVRADWTGGETAVISGVFLGGAGTPPPPPPPPGATVDIPGVQGSWVGSYGHDGFVLADWDGSTDLASLPAGVTFSAEQASRYSWAAPTTDVRGLQSSDALERRARTWYDATQVRLRLTFANGYVGMLHAYAVDWDSYGPRGETIAVDDGQGPRSATLAAGGFVQGAWFHAAINVPPGGSALLTVTRTAGGNGVLSGIFLGGPGASPPPPPPPLTVDVPGTQGTWLGTVGSAGYILGDWTGTTDLASLPAGTTFAVEQASRYSWAAPTTDVRALQSPDGTERRARAWYDGTEVRIRLTFTAAFTGTLHAYAVDWDSYGPRGETVTINDGRGARTATLGQNTFVQGAWVHGSIVVPAGGSVVVTVDRTAGGNGVLSGLFLDAAASPTAPGPPTGVVATRGDSQVVLSWSAPSSDGGSPITGYTATASPGGKTCATSGTLGCAILELTNGTTYSFVVAATNAAGTGPSSAAVEATPATLPGAPTGLTATAGNGQVALSWVAPAGNGGSALTGYKLYRGTASSGETLLTSLGNVTSYADSGLANGTTYWYQVTAVNGVGEGGRSAEASGKPTAPATVPGAASALTATRGNAQIGLMWTAPASTGGSPITGYNVYRGGAAGTETILTTLGNVTTFSDTGLANGTPYWYVVKALNAVGEGPASNEVSATPATVPGPPAVTATRGNAQVVVSWTAPASGGSAITNYRIYRGTASGGETLLTTLGNVLTYTDTGRTNGTTYWYQVTAVNAVGDSARSTETSATPATAPGAPRNPSAKTASPKGVLLSWLAPASNGGSAVTNYRIYRGTAAGGESLLATVGNVLSFADTATVAGVRYYYRIAAVNAVSEGVQSGEVNARAR